ncbi:DUF1657 domain-containing protein [Bacillus sp. FSL K6-3431]|uniref:DUF1657 domain-containing protein n=1 Tax=Bacillus sp. FSL K6-3431 TaxID=2921500 RepID=UPI0030FA171C
MTIIANIKASHANAKGIQAEFSHLAQVAADEDARAIFHECMLDVEKVVQNLHLRIEYMKAEELQYRNS